ncbi:dihydropyrimidinase [Paenibacillus sp. GP183]|jgi:dihydropyrimidinase|uniref:dihydropyrimidinase n=1 Tax=Paenibacillus sp. GP183 TaxID=1882751 RepID=UPI00089C52E7|nr:dihydropyrimidinase [Paenibacillus sp. GP183]SEC81346.1 dihydropyrimidinase [Paenibacillus sp. GP183]
MSKKWIKNGIIVTSSDTYQADLLIDGGEIIGIGKMPDIDNAEVIDASGLYVFPGAVDEHTHMSMPFNGTESMPWESETVAAAVGGTTTIVDFALQARGSSLTDTIRKWQTRAEGNTAIDYNLHVAITDLTNDIMEEISTAVKLGVSTFKLFMAYKGELMVDDSTMFRMLQKAKEVGALVMVHAENGDIISLLQQQLLSEGKTEPYYHAVSRPIDIETEATHRAIKLAKAAGSPIFIVHVSSGEPAEEIRRARASGQPVFAETCPQYLFLDESYLALPDFEGAKYVCSPPLREKSQHEQLWNAITDGTLQAIGTDHCSFDFKNQKYLGRNDFSKIPNGGNGIEHWIPLLYTYGVKAGKISLNRFIELISANPAKFMGLYPRKGTIAVGSDADLVLFDPKVEQTITASSQLQGSDYNFYEGWQVQGAARHVLLRGEVIVKNGTYVGSRTQGQFIHAKPFGAAFQKVGE